MKECTKCFESKPFSAFGKFIHSKDGLKPHCKACRSSTGQNYYLANREAIREKVRVSNATNPESNRSRVARWRKDNPEKVLELSRRRENRRRARKKENGFAFYAESEVLNVYGTTCHLCNVEIDLLAPRKVGRSGWENGLHIDHLVPIAKGGSDTLENVRPAHGKCNLEKSSKG
jgi:5-methylcytosine-specific restriction endonuclease McrA